MATQYLDRANSVVNASGETDASPKAAGGTRASRICGSLESFSIVYFNFVAPTATHKWVGDEVSQVDGIIRTIRPRDSHPR